jgi:hypothetical protein
MTGDRLMKREGKHLFLMSIDRARLRCWKEEVKTKKLVLLAPFHLLSDGKLQE